MTRSRTSVCFRVTCSGFTLLEVLLTITLLAILASITIVAINPAKQLADSRDATREADVFLMLQTLYQYAADHDGAFPETITTAEQEICVTGAVDCSNLADLSILTTGNAYTVTMPRDPLCDSVVELCSSSGTGYFVSLATSSTIRIRAPGAENRSIDIIK